MIVKHAFTEEDQIAIENGTIDAEKYTDHELTLLLTEFRCDRCSTKINGLTVGRIMDKPYTRQMHGDYCPSCFHEITHEFRRICDECHKEYYESVAEIKRTTCRACRFSRPVTEVRRVRYHLARAIKAGTPATLTVPEWLETVRHFKHRCAYCGGAFQILEHYIPIRRGGGTTVDNCVPSCWSCDTRKFDRMPDKPLFTHVGNYLASVRYARIPLGD